MDMIDAEKAQKPRPDLLPALAVDRLQFANMPERCKNPVLIAWRCLIFFRLDLDMESLEDALIYTALALGGVPQACMAGGRVMGYGFQKHGNCTWRVAGTSQADPQTHIASAERHLIEYLIDQDACEEGSGLPVLEHAFSQLCITYDLVLRPPRLVGQNDHLGTVTERLYA